MAVDEGVVTLTGRVDNDDTQNEITDVVKRVEGVRLVLNQTDTDEEVMTGWEFARQEAGNFFGYLSRKWILILLSLAIVAGSVAAGAGLRDALRDAAGPDRAQRPAAIGRRVDHQRL